MYLVPVSEPSGSFQDQVVVNGILSFGRDNPLFGQEPGLNMNESIKVIRDVVQNAFLKWMHENA